MKGLLLAGAFAFFFVFALAPPLWLLASAFFDGGSFTLESVRAILLDQRQIGLLWHSVVVGCLATLLSCAIGVPVGAALARLRLPAEGLLRLFYLVPVMLPTYVIGIAWTQHVPLRGLSGIVLLLALSYWPVVALFAEKGVRGVGREVEDAARLQGPAGRAFFAVTLRLALPSILMGALFVFVFSVSDFGIPDLLSFTSSTSFQVYSSEIFYRWDKLRRSGEAAAAALPVIALCLAALAAILKLEGRARRVSLRSGFAPAEGAAPAGWLRWVCFGVAAAAILASVLVPLGTLVLWLRRAGDAQAVARVVAGSIADTGGDAFNSVLSSIVAALFMTAAGFFLAYAVERSSGWKRSGAALFALLPLAFPAVMIGVGEIRFWNHPWNPFSDAVYDRQPMLVATYFARFAPVAMLSLRSSLAQIDERLEEASLAAGRGFAGTAGRVLLPLSWRGLWVAFLLAYVLCMRELDAIAIIGAGNDTLPFRIYSQIHTSRDVAIAAHCLVLILTLLVPPLVFRLLVRGRVRVV